MELKFEFQPLGEEKVEQLKGLCGNEVGLYFEDGTPVPPLSPLLEAFAEPEVVKLIKEAKEKHQPVLIANKDNTHAILFKDANEMNFPIYEKGGDTDQREERGGEETVISRLLTTDPMDNLIILSIFATNDASL